MNSNRPLASSPQTQEIVDLCLRVAEEPNLRSELQDKAQDRLDEMQRVEDAFFAGVDAQGAEFYQSLRTSIERVEEQFRAYGDALEALLEDDVDTASVAFELAEASQGMRASMGAYEEAYLSRGPDRYPVVNLFRNVIEGVLDGKMAQNLQTATCDRFQTFYAAAVKEIEESKAGERPGIDERKQAYLTILSVIEELRGVTELDKLEPLLGRLSEAHATLENVFDTFHRQELAEGPSQSANINALVKAAEGVLKGDFEPSVLEAMAQSLLDLTQQNLASMKNLGRNKIESEVVSEELERMIEAVEEIEDALTFLLDFSQGVTKNVKEAREAIEDLIDSGDALVESSTIVEDLQKVTCIQCQTKQEKGSRVCVACGAVLPQQAGDQNFGAADSTFQVLEGVTADDLDRDEVMTDVMQELFQACEDFINGQVKAAALQEIIARHLILAQQAQQKLDALRTPSIPTDATPEDRDVAEDFVGLAEDALDLLTQGIEQCLSGLSAMKKAAPVDDLETLRSGMREYYEGQQRMWQVRRLERQLDDYIQPLLTKQDDLES